MPVPGATGRVKLNFSPADARVILEELCEKLRFEVSNSVSSGIRMPMNTGVPPFRDDEVDREDHWS
jgi:hypothetical protein